MKIYFGHPKNTYDTEYEKNCIDRIKELYPGAEIINPKDIKIADEDRNTRGYGEFMTQMNKYFFPVVDSCDMLIVAKTRRGKISGGVRKEIQYVENKSISVKYLDVPFIENNRLEVAVSSITGTDIQEDKRSDVETILCVMKENTDCTQSSQQHMESLASELNGLLIKKKAPKYIFDRIERLSEMIVDSKKTQCNFLLAEVETLERRKLRANPEIAELFQTEIDKIIACIMQICKIHSI